MPLDKSSRLYTNINLHRALFENNRLVFGLKTAPANFQDSIETLYHLSVMGGVIVYFDDIMVMGSDRLGRKTFTGI